MFEHLPFGQHLKLTLRGASHAKRMTFALSGVPDDFTVDEARLATFMARRAPGQDSLSTARKETDNVKLVRVGDQIVGTIENIDKRPQDYGVECTVPRPGHADFGQWVETGRIPTGGGNNSGRMTALMCAAGGICLQLLERRGIRVKAEAIEIGGKAGDFEKTILEAKARGDSVGGVVRCTATGLKPGLGGAMHAGLESEISAALYAIPGVKGVEFGYGFDSAVVEGSYNNDPFVIAPDKSIVTVSNKHGGILGGRTTGMPVELTVAFKPTPTIFKQQESVDLELGTSTTREMKGRHDPCIVLRAVPVVEAMVAFSLADRILATEAALPRLCLTLTGTTLVKDIRQFRSQRYFTDLVELRADLLEEDELADVSEIPERIDVPVILTYRRKADGGAFTGSEKTREKFFARVLKEQLSRATRFAYVDFESDFTSTRLTRAAEKAGIRIIRSRHVFKGKIKSFRQACRELRGNTTEIPKLAFTPHSLADVSRLLEETRDFTDFPHIICAMGPIGFPSRVLAARTHSLLTYGSVSGLGELGHVSPAELVRNYRMRTQGREAFLYGVTGWPLKATRSPELHNAAFAREDIDAVMIPFPARTAREAVDFMQETRMLGLAVTIPHKETVIPLLDRLSPEARAIGAVNTVVLDAGEYIGYNTDATGFREAITAFMGKASFRNLPVAVLGAGGASKAVVWALKSLGAKVRVFHRETPPQGFRLIVNATPVDPIPDYVFAGKEAVYDLVYTPEETPLMARARAAGCAVQNGFTMLVAQAREQQRLWAEARD